MSNKVTIAMIASVCIITVVAVLAQTQGSC